MAGPEFNPADDVQPTKEDYEAWERECAWSRFIDWLCEDDGETPPIEQIQEDWRASGVDVSLAIDRMRQLIDKVTTPDGRPVTKPIEESPGDLAVRELAAQTHGCHACGEERPPRLVAGKLTCPECGSENLVCID